MTRRYRLTRGAANDLQAIVKYTRAQWGDVQCREYVAQLKRTAAVGLGVPAIRTRTSGQENKRV